MILGPRDAAIRAKAALVGKLRFTESELRIYQVEVQFEGLDAVCGEAPLQSVSSTGLSGTRRVEWTYGAIGNPKSTIQWSDDGAELELRFDDSVTKLEEAYFYQVMFSPVLLLRFQEPIGFDAVFSDWIEPLRRIISLSTGRRERTTYVAVGTSPNDLSTSNAGIRAFNFQVYGSDLQQEPFASRGNDVREIKCAFRVSADDLSLLSLLRQWQVLAADHHPLLETYGAMMFARDQHPRSRFLLLIQSIEGLHGNETWDVYKKKKETHRSLRRSVLEEASETLSPESFKFLKTFLMKEPISGLDQRIRAVLAGAPVDVGTELEATPLVRKVQANELQKENPTRPDLAGALRIIRNDLAHGNRGYDAGELDEVVELLDGVVRAHLLRILGCPEEAQKLAQDQRR